MNTIAVTDTLSNKPENIQAIADILGRGQRRDLFSAVYKSNKRSWSAVEVGQELGINEKKASALCLHLYNSGILHRDGAHGSIRYKKVSAIQPLAKKILGLRGEKKAIEAIITKRTSALSGTIFVAPPNGRNVSRRVRDVVAAKLRIAVLMAAPTDQKRINVGWDYKEASRAVTASPNCNKIDLKAVPAADPNDLLDSLNQFKPHVVHFAGHGDDDLILMDGTTVTQTSGSIVNMNLVHDLMEATSTPPKLVIFTACNTFPAANVLSSNIDAVISMSGEISDTSAAIFSNRFYAAVSAGEKLSNAFSQAKTSLKIARRPDANLPEIHYRTPEAANLRLVN